MPSLLDDPYGDPGQSGRSLLGLDMPQIAQPDPDTDQGAALAETYRRVMAEMERQQQISADRGLWDDRTGLPTGAGLVSAANQTAQGLLMGTTAPGIRAFHGSPYDFERFDTSKIGTGEGAQAYGHGLYFAGNEGVANTYKFANQPAYMNTATANVAQDAYQQAVKSGATDPLAAARNSLWEQRNATDDPIVRRRIDDAYNNIEQLTQPGGAGHMYQVNIGADPEQFLHWDKPLSEQSQFVQDRLADVLRLQKVPPKSNVGAETTGGLMMQYLDGRLGSVDAANELASSGIPGIRYLDQGSRGAGEGTHNYVVFDANTIDILRKYGLAGLGIGLSAAATRQQPEQ